MAVSILTITHGNVGQELLSITETIIRKLPLACASLSASSSCIPDKLISKAEKECEKLDQGDGVLVLTDIYGSTPSNICNKINTPVDIRVVAGLNLPMLVRVMNYPTLSLDELTEKAISGAHDGIVNCHE